MRANSARACSAPASAVRERPRSRQRAADEVAQHDDDGGADRVPEHRGVAVQLSARGSDGVLGLPVEGRAYERAPSVRPTVLGGRADPGIVIALIAAGRVGHVAQQGAQPGGG